MSAGGTMSDSAERKYYTVEQANKTLPYVRAIVGDIVEKYRAIVERRQRLDRIRRGKKSRETVEDPYSEELQQTEADLDRELDELAGFELELSKLGIELKDPQIGLIDYYAQMDGREVYLCWMLGEDEIAHWHELDAGFQGRQSLLAESGPTRPRGGRKSKGTPPAPGTPPAGGN